MIWNDRRIYEWASTGGVTPFAEDLVNPASLDLRLGNMIREPRPRWWTRQPNSAIDKATKASELWTDAFEFERYILEPGQSVLCHSVEYIRMPVTAAGFLASKSSTGRMLLEHFHCLSGDTLIDAPRDVSRFPGGIPIKDLVGRPFLTYAFDLNAMNFVLAPAVAFPARKNAKVVRVTYEWMTGRRWKTGSIVCTPDHRFLTLDGRWVEAQDLNDERLQPFWRWADGRYAGIMVDPLRKRTIREHRFVAEQVYDLGNLQVHHVNGNKMDNSPENLQPIESGAHQSLHSSGDSNPFWGKTHTEKTKRVFSEQRSGRKLHDRWRESLSVATSGENNPRYVEVPLSQIITAYSQAGTLSGAASIIGIHECTLLEKIRQNGFSGAVEFRKRVGSMDNHKVVSVDPLPDTIDTFDIHVPDYENFVANGVVVHNSGWFDPGFVGNATLELKNDGMWEIVLRPGDLWVQLILMNMAEAPLRDYSQTGRYQGQTGPEAHR